MTVLAATATPVAAVPAWLALAGLAVLAAAAYAVSCWWWPFTACRRCDGTGRRSRGDRRVWRDCPRCKGSGRRLRAGRWAWEAWQRWRKATG